jgi:hypothetical protein
MKRLFLAPVFLLGLLAAVLFASGGGAAPPCGKGNHPPCPTTSTTTSTTTTVPSTTTEPPPTTTAPVQRWAFKGIHSSWNNGDVGAKDLGFDVITVSPDVARLDVLQANGLRGLIWLGGYDNATCQFVDNDDWVVAHVSAIKDHPAVLAYEIDNEPHFVDCPNAPSQMAARNALVKSLDPDALTYLTLYKDFSAFLGSVDLIRISRYPCSYPDGCVYSKITDTVAAAEAAGWTRYWAGPQIFGDEYYKPPTPEELRMIFDTWRGTNAEAMVAYTWNYAGVSDPLNVHPELWDTVKAENAGG